MTRLTDTQCVLLSSAAKRENLSLYPLPDGLNPKGGLAKAISPLSERGLIEERLTTDLAVVNRKDDDQWFGLFVTAAGLTAIGVTIGDEQSLAASEPRQLKAVVGSKINSVMTLLRRDEGATLEEMVATTGWLPHTTRAALTGLKKKGYVIERDKRDDRSCYFIRAAA